MSRPRSSQQWLLLRATPLPAGGWGEALGSVGRFPSNSLPGALPIIRTPRAHPHTPTHTGVRGRTTSPRPPPASPPSHPRRVHPRSRQQPRLWTAGRLSHTLGPKERGHRAAPGRRGQAPAAPRNRPSCARRGALHSWPGWELRCLPLCPPAPEGASKAFPEPLLPAAGTPSSLPRQPGRGRFDFARCSAHEAAKPQLSEVGLPAHLWKKLALIDAPSTFFPLQPRRRPLPQTHH